MHNFSSETSEKMAFQKAVGTGG